MPDKSIMALPDIHSDPAARVKAREMLLDGHVGVFYIEWSKPIDPDNLDKTFEGLAPGDAKPTLKELTRLALDHGIPVKPVDIAPETVLQKLDAESPDYAPHGQLSLFQPWGQAVRDRETAQLIGNDMKDRADGTIGLVMYGADHFKPKIDDGKVLAGALDALIRDQGAADVYLLKPAFGQVHVDSSASQSDHAAVIDDHKEKGVSPKV